MAQKSVQQWLHLKFWLHVLAEQMKIRKCLKISMFVYFVASFHGTVIFRTWAELMILYRSNTEKERAVEKDKYELEDPCLTVIRVINDVARTLCCLYRWRVVRWQLWQCLSKHKPIRSFHFSSASCIYCSSREKQGYCTQLHPELVYLKKEKIVLHKQV